MAKTESMSKKLLFGREPDLAYLLQRAQTRGITVLAARPKMGKTCTLLEMEHRLKTQQTAIVGYHESKGAEVSHMLYVVSNLYAQWLADSDFREQALSQWERHKKNLIPKVGQAVGHLFQELSSLTKVVPNQISGLVQKSFDGLAAAQADLQQGGLTLPTLDYDQARDLTNLVAKVSGKKVVLVLDAWEKSQTLCTEHETLEAFLNHPEAWPDCHLFLGIRQPEINTPEKEDDAFRRAKDLDKRSAEVVIHRLPTMHLDSDEQKRMMMHLRSCIPALEGLDDASVLKQIEGFPGVLDHWLSPSNRVRMRGFADLKQQARDAQDYRYREFDRLFPDLSRVERTCCVRLAFLPRMDEVAWEALQGLILGTEDESLLDELRAKGILEHALDYPTFGHDTRHAAADRWFMQQHRPLVKREFTLSIWALAKTIDQVSEQNRVANTALAHCVLRAKRLSLDAATCLLTDCARSLFGEDEQNFRTDFEDDALSALKKDPSVAPLIATALNNRGARKGDLGDHKGAITDYDAVIDLPGVPADQIARALYNRGVSKGALGDSKGAIADYDAVIDLPDATVDQIARALYNRGVGKGDLGDREGEIADYDAVIDLPSAPAEQIAKALNNRGVTKGALGLGDREAVLTDLRAALTLFTELDQRENQEKMQCAIADFEKQA